MALPSHALHKRAHTSVGLRRGSDGRRPAQAGEGGAHLPRVDVSGSDLALPLRPAQAGEGGVQDTSDHIGLTALHAAVKVQVARRPWKYYIYIYIYIYI